VIDLNHADPSSPLGYVVAFTVPLLDAFFPIVPSESVVVGLGVLASRTFDDRLIPLVALVALGAFCGDNISYWLGHRFGERIVNRFMRGEKGQKTRAWAERTLQKYGMRLLIVARFIPGGRTAVTLTAGATHYPYGRFRVGVTVAAVIWTVYCFGIGLIGGHAFEDNTLAALALGFGIAGAASVLIEVVRRLIARRRTRADGRGQPAGTSFEGPADADPNYSP
jgi:membrane-associated protein